MSVLRACLLNRWTTVPGVRLSPSPQIAMGRRDCREVASKAGNGVRIFPAGLTGASYPDQSPGVMPRSGGPLHGQLAKWQGTELQPPQRRFESGAGLNGLRPEERSTRADSRERPAPTRPRCSRLHDGLPSRKSEFESRWSLRNAGVA